MRLASRWVVGALASVTMLLGSPGTAAAAPAERSGPLSTVGYDVSHPQCGTELPTPGAFAVIGVNGGLATRANPCLAAQLEWADGSSGTVPGQPAVQLYLNTANPGELRDQVTTWPSAGSTPYGRCDGDNSKACSWQYGWERARTSVESFFRPAARAAGLDSRPAGYTWWLDVETMNTWQSGSTEARARNRATLEGMTEYLTDRDGEVGLYSTGYQWGRIVGEVPANSPLGDLPSWLAGALTLRQAVALCDEPALVPRGEVELTQYVPDDLDLDHACG
ncbi:hypothetical protein DQ244_02270 [Blastococcus sp. TBT05-19]|uniref:hypothetical protein n=1 Tax=Blastococcus sp. TBT05-19 TaxID=2250581 RepID=UPI000DE85467|nr:hypothetical protein [Blastococcus sp. TBT05-19]RBY94198.1 hypothetical protein DQ244_02270 [Blastococcus sp. TBT05-19]